MQAIFYGKHKRAGDDANIVPCFYVIGNSIWCMGGRPRPPVNLLRFWYGHIKICRGELCSPVGNLCVCLRANAVRPYNLYAQGLFNDYGVSGG